MGRLRQRMGLLRQITALVPVFALLLHIAAMALGAMGPLGPGSETTQLHAHHSASASQPGADGPSADPDHKPPCCILSVCPGLPGPPTGHALAYLPRETADVVFFDHDAVPTTPRLRLRPGGARAPPALA